jgi:flagellar export protein FliJ
MVLRSKRLNRLVDLRKQQTEHIRRIFAKATERVFAGEAQMRAIHQETVALNEEWRASAQQGVSAAHAVQFQRVTHGLLQRLNTAAEELDQARAAESEARWKLGEAMKKQKAVEKLQKKFKEREVQDEQRHEQAELDEFAVLRTTSGAK